MSKIKFYILLLLSFSFASCASTTLYNWGEYEEAAYENYDKQTPESLCDLIEEYEHTITTKGGIRNTVPPGLCAEYGYFLLQDKTPSIFNEYATNSQKRMFKTSDYESFFKDKGVKMLQMEVELYPESSQFIVPLLDKLKKDIK